MIRAVGEIDDVRGGRAGEEFDQFSTPMRFDRRIFEVVEWDIDAERGMNGPIAEPADAIADALVDTVSKDG